MSVQHKYGQVVPNLVFVRVLVLGSEVICIVCIEIGRMSVHALVILVSYVHVFCVLFTYLCSGM